MTVRALRAGSIRLALLSAAVLLPAAPGLAQTAPSEAPQQQEASRPQSRAFDRVFSGSDAVAEPGRFLVTVFEGQDSIDRGPLGTSLPDGPYLGVNPSVSLRGGSGFSLTSTSDIRRYTDTGEFQIVNGSAGFSAQLSGRRTGLRLFQNVAYVPYQQFFATTAPGLSPFSGVTGDGTIADRAGRQRSTTTVATSVSAARQLSRWVVLTGAYDNQYRHLGAATDLTDSSSDTMVHNLSARLNRQIGRYSVLFAGYGTRFQTQTSPGVEPLRSHDISLGLDRSQQLSLFRKTTLRFSTGSSIVRVTGGHRVLLTGMATLRHELTRTWALELYTNRGVTYLEGVRDPVVANSLYVRTSGHLLPRTELFAQGGYSKGALGVSGPTGNYNVYSTSFQVRTRLTSSVGVYGEWNGYKQRADTAAGLPDALVRDLYRQGFRIGVLMTVPIQSQRGVR
jgi:hypothetical protein